MTADSEDGREERAAPAQPAVIDANRPACMRTRLGAVGTSVTIIGAAGSTAAISAIFGNL